MKPTFARESPEACIAQLRSRISELEQERAAVNSFAATAAHELLEPLVVIEAYAAMIGEQLRASQGEAGMVDDLGRAASRLRRLVEIILHDARSSAEVLRSEEVDLQVVVHEVVGLHSHRIVNQGVSVEVAELPSVKGDEALLGSVVSNLLANALKHGPPVGGRIKIRSERRGHHWQVIIEDDGPHIGDADRARIFEPYQRASSGHRSRGAGLGLAICKRIVERHGGTIGVAAGERGNEFFFTLPA